MSRIITMQSTPSYEDVPCTVSTHGRSATLLSQLRYLHYISSPTLMQMCIIIHKLYMFYTYTKKPPSQRLFGV